MKVIEMEKTRRKEGERGMKNYKYFVVYDVIKSGAAMRRGSGDIVSRKKIEERKDINEIEDTIAKSLKEEDVKCDDVMLTNYILMGEIKVGEEDMEKLSRLEDIAVKMAELYSRETGENYDNDLKESIYKILVERC